jgi:hypothetical protein
MQASTLGSASTTTSTLASASASTTTSSDDMQASTSDEVRKVEVNNGSSANPYTFTRALAAEVLSASRFSVIIPTANLNSHTSHNSNTKNSYVSDEDQVSVNWHEVEQDSVDFNYFDGNDKVQTMHVIEDSVKSATDGDSGDGSASYNSNTHSNAGASDDGEMCLGCFDKYSTTVIKKRFKHIIATDDACLASLCNICYPKFFEFPVRGGYICTICRKQVCRSPSSLTNSTSAGTQVVNNVDTDLPLHMVAADAQGVSAQYFEDDGQYYRRLYPNNSFELERSPSPPTPPKVKFLKHSNLHNDFEYFGNNLKTWAYNYGKLCEEQKSGSYDKPIIIARHRFYECLDIVNSICETRGKSKFTPEKDFYDSYSKFKSADESMIKNKKVKLCKFSMTHCNYQKGCIFLHEREFDLKNKKYCYEYKPPNAKQLTAKQQERKNNYFQGQKEQREGQQYKK